MCNSFENTDLKSVIGYKLVAKKADGRYYSILTGNKYPLNGREIPTWVSQKNMMSVFFITGILPGNRKELSKFILNDRSNPAPLVWSKEMVGRTAAFKNELDGISFFHEFIDFERRKEAQEYEHSIKLVKVRLTGGLLKAKYQRDNKSVYVGRRMTIIQEVSR